ncbi:hypothetical protein [Clostridium sp.]
MKKNTFRWPDGSSGNIAIDEREFRWLLDGLSIKQRGAHKPTKERIII